jgi:hypothetical protein
MNILFIVMMAVGILAILVSFFLNNDEKESAAPISFGAGNAKGDFDKDEAIFNTEAKEEAKAADAIEAAKRKAREAVNKDYKFDLHLTQDSSNQTVEELERDLLGGLDLSDNAEIVEEVAEPEPVKPASNSSKSSKKKNRKKNAPKNDRYDDLLYEDTTATAAEAEEKVEEVAEVVQNASKNTSKNNKKGKKK